ncbi:TRAP transporter small permease [Chloroflexota bacterium]
MKRLTKVVAIFDRALDLMVYFATALLIFMMLAVSMEVVQRYFLNRPSVWVIEISEILLLYMTFLGAAWLQRREGHVRIDLVLNRLKPKIQILLGIITSIIGVVISCVLFWYGVRVTWDYFQRGLLTPTYLAFPYAPILVIIPIGGFMLLIQFLRSTMRCHGKTCR